MPGLSGLIQRPKSDHWLLGILTYQYKGYLVYCTSPPCGLIRSLQVAKKLQSTSPGLGGNNPKLDAVVDGNFPDDLDSASIFSKVISHKPPASSGRDLYLHCRKTLWILLSESRLQISWIWGSRPSTHWIKAVSLVLLLPGFEDRHIYPIGARQIMCLVKRQ